MVRRGWSRSSKLSGLTELVRAVEPVDRRHFSSHRSEKGLLVKRQPNATRCGWDERCDWCHVHGGKHGCRKSSGAAQRCADISTHAVNDGRWISRNGISGAGR